MRCHAASLFLGLAQFASAQIEIAYPRDPDDVLAALADANTEDRRGLATRLVDVSRRREPGHLIRRGDRELLELILVEEDPDVLEQLFRANAVRGHSAVWILDNAGAMLERWQDPGALPGPMAELSAALEGPWEGWPFDPIAPSLLDTVSSETWSRSHRECLLLLLSTAPRLPAPVISDLERALDGGGRRAWVAAILAAHGAALSREPLEQATRQGNDNTRHWAALGLMRAAGERGLVPADWRRYIHSPEPDLAAAAIAAVGRHPDPPEGIVRGLGARAARFLVQPSNHRSRTFHISADALAISVLRGMASRASPAMIELERALADADGLAAARVAEVLAAIGPAAESAIPALIAALERAIVTKDRAAAELERVTAANPNQRHPDEERNRNDTSLSERAAARAIAEAVRAIAPQRAARVLLARYAGETPSGTAIQLLGHLMPSLGHHLGGEIGRFMAWLESGDPDLQGLALQALVGVGPAVTAVRDELMERIKTAGIRHMGLALAVLCSAPHEEPHAVIDRIERHWPDASEECDFPTLFSRLNGLPPSAEPLLRAAAASSEPQLVRAARALAAHLQTPSERQRAAWFETLRRRNGRTGAAASLGRMGRQPGVTFGFTPDEACALSECTNPLIRAMLLEHHLRGIGLTPREDSPLDALVEQVSTSPSHTVALLRAAASRRSLFEHLLANPNIPQDLAWTECALDEQTNTRAVELLTHDDARARRTGWMLALTGGAKLGDLRPHIDQGLREPNAPVRTAAADCIQRATR